MSESRPIATRAMADALADADLRDVLPSIAVPTLLIYGDADERAPLIVAEDLHRRIPTSRLVVLPGRAQCYLEAPDRFNAEVRRSSVSSLTPRRFKRADGSSDVSGPTMVLLRRNG